MFVVIVVVVVGGVMMTTTTTRSSGGIVCRSSFGGSTMTSDTPGTATGQNGWNDTTRIVVTIGMCLTMIHTGIMWCVMIVIIIIIILRGYFSL